MKNLKKMLLKLDKELEGVGFRSITYDRIVKEMKELSDIIKTVDKFND